jgi:hypothetical protein
MGKPKIYESPDKGKTVYEREFHADSSTRRIVNTSIPQQLELQYTDSSQEVKSK